MNKKLVMGLVVCFLVGAGIASYIMNSIIEDNAPADPEPMIIAEEPIIAEPVEEIEDEPTWPQSITTGLAFEGADTARKQFSIMVENSPQARPHTGLVAADIVYEIETEYNITRFLAVFSDELPEKIGPARSSRHYFVPLAESWNVPYVHFGGSPQAYKLLEDISVSRIDGIYDGKHFKRDNSRKAPHNAYFHTTPFSDSGNSIENGKFAFNEKGDAVSGETATTLSLDYNNFTNVKYVYNEQTLKYERHLEEAPHGDRETKQQIAPSNVVVLFAGHERIEGDDAGRIDVDLTSGGDTRYFTQGKTFTGAWKVSQGEMKFYDAYGSLVKLTPGKTWIQVVDAKKADILSFR